jgi:hypothetical protein
VTSTVDALAELCAHLAEFELPGITSVHVADCRPAPEVTVQLSCREPSAIAAGLLAWADALAQATAQAWRVPPGRLGARVRDWTAAQRRLGSSLPRPTKHRLLPRRRARTGHHHSCVASDPALSRHPWTRYRRGRPLMTTPGPTTPDIAQMTRAQRAVLPLSADVAQALAEQHGVCIRPLAMRRIDTSTGRVDIVPVPCGSTREDQCRPCAEKARRLRMAQCREGWHLDTEPVTDRTKPSAEHTELMATRADLLAAYTECKTTGDELTCEQIADSVAELDSELRAAGVRGRLTPLDPPPKPVKRSTRRRQDAPDLPR